MHLFASAAQLAMHAPRFGSTLKYCARHSAMQDCRFGSHAACAASRVGSAATWARTAAAMKSRNVGAKLRIGYGRMYVHPCSCNCTMRPMPVGTRFVPGSRLSSLPSYFDCAFSVLSQPEMVMACGLPTSAARRSLTGELSLRTMLSPGP